jgi:mRNA interferase RelE/StbE
LIYQVDILPAAQKIVLEIADRRVQEKILESMTALAAEPELQGKPLDDDLADYRSIRAVGQRYRIIYVASM